MDFGFFLILFHPRYAISSASKDGRCLMGGSHVVHRGVVEDSTITWPTRQFIMVILRWFGDSFQLRMVWGYIGTNFPRFVYYYGPTILGANVVPLILWMCIAHVVI